MKFKKILSVLGGALLIGSSMGVALANTYPTPFVQDGNHDVAIVYGASSAPTDLVAAQSIEANLKSVFDSFEYPSVASGNFSGSSGVVENEVFLGTELQDSNNGDMRAVFTDNQIPSLIDEKIYWDDGVSTKTSFNVHEEILVGGMKLLTTLDDKDLDGVALTNNKDLEYRYVFEDTLNTSFIGDDDADTLTIDILGKEYEVEEFEDDSVTISSSKQEVLKTGDTLLVEGVTLTIEDIFEDTIQVNGEFIREGRTGTVDGLKVQVESIAYHSSETLESKVIFKVGKEISTTYYNGDAYIGEDEEEPNWIWSINEPGKADGFIGVKYEQSQIDSDDNVVYVGESYIFPENYAAVSLGALTDVDYADFEVSFDDSKNLYYANDSNMKMYDDAKVLVLSGDSEDSFLVDNFETDEVYLKYTNLSHVIHHDAIINETVIIPEWNQTEIYGKLELTNKDSSWVPISSNEIEINYTVEGDTFGYNIVSGSIPAGFELVYAMDKENRFNPGSYATVKTVAEINLEGEGLPMSGDWNANADPNYCEYHNTFDSYEHCVGAKLWIINSNDIENNGVLTWANMDDYYYETDLITYSDENVLIHHDAVINGSVISPEWDEFVYETVVEVFYNDVDKDYSSSVKPRYAFTLNGDGNIGELVYEDTELDIDFDSTSRTLTLGDLTIKVNPTGEFTHLGGNDANAEDDELLLNGKEIGDQDEDILGYDGLIVYNSESNSEEDEVVLGVPSEQVYATVSVLGEGIELVEDVPQFGSIIVTDAEVASVSDKNLIVVGGSCINSVAAQLLGVPVNTCGEAFTKATGIGSGQHLLEEYVSPFNDQKIAILVAGYEASGTTAGVNSLLA